MQRPGKSWRHIDNPIGELKQLQKAITRIVRNDVQVPTHLHGGIRKRSPVTAAIQHLGQVTLVTLDVSKYFDNVKCRAVYRFFANDMMLAPDLARALTSATTRHGHLPQGSPCSTLLANMANRPMFAAIAAVCARYRCIVTVFVDDICVSGADARSCIGPLVAILARFGYRAAPGKTQIMGRGAEKTALGIQVSDVLALPSAKRTALLKAINSLSTSERVLHWQVERVRGQIDHAETIDRPFAKIARGRFEAFDSSVRVVLDEPAPVDERHDCDWISCRARKLSPRSVAPTGFDAARAPSLPASSAKATTQQARCAGAIP